MKGQNSHEVMGLVIFRDGSYEVATGVDREIAALAGDHLTTLPVTDVLDAIMTETARVSSMNLAGFAPTSENKESIQ